MFWFDCRVQILGEEQGEVGLSSSAHEHVGRRGGGFPAEGSRVLEQDGDIDKQQQEYRNPAL